jgi:hypothetical protein
LRVGKRAYATYDREMQRWAKVIALVCVVCAIGYLAGTQESRAPAAITANLVPPNDDFADTAPLVGAAGARDGTTAGATLENGEDHLYPVRGSDWFRWRAPWSGWATFDTCRARFDVELDVYTGPSLLELERVYLDDDGCARERAFRADFKAAAGTVYRIAVSTVASRQLLGELRGPTRHAFEGQIESKVSSA